MKFYKKKLRKENPALALKMHKDEHHKDLQNHHEHEHEHHAHQPIKED